MLAYDAPEERVPAWDYCKVSLPEYLDRNRNGRGWPKPVVAWHVTPRENVEAILRDGLRGSRCGQHTSSHTERPYATYLFCSRSVVKANVAALLGDDASDYAVLQVTIPTEHLGKLHDDGLYNMSIPAAMMSAIQYHDDIPATWIEVES